MLPELGQFPPRTGCTGGGWQSEEAPNLYHDRHFASCDGGRRDSFCPGSVCLSPCKPTRLPDTQLHCLLEVKL